MEALLVEQDGGVLTLTLNRPERKNSITGEMLKALIDAVEGVQDDVRVIALRATGDDFCSGFDIGGGGGGGAAGGARPKVGHLHRSFQKGPHRLIKSLDEVQVPVVAGVRGWAAGLGNSLALSADVVIASPSAKFWVPFVTRGFTPDSGNTWLLPRLVGLARAKEMILRGQPVDGETAAAWGLVSRCVAEDELDAAVDEVVADFARAATASVGLAKTLIHRNLEVDLTSGLQNEGVYEDLAVRSDDFKEGMRAFAEKRDPDYTGR